MPRFLDTVPILKPKRSSFDLSNRYKFTARFSQLIPTVCIPTLPTDHFSISASFQARLGALINPIYDDITARIEWFFVPNEIIWPGWKQFITGGNSEGVAGLNVNAFPTIEFFYPLPFGGNFEAAFLMLLGRLKIVHGIVISLQLLLMSLSVVLLFLLILHQVVLLFLS